MTVQLTLGVQLQEHLTFDNLIEGENAVLISLLKNTVRGQGEPVIYLWGEPGAGRTHLLQACCHLAGQCDRTSTYLPLNTAAEFTPEIFQSLETLDMVCLDDIENLADKPAWEEALFHLYNRLQTRAIPLILTANRAPTQLPIALPDLRSRLAAGLTFRLQPLNDDQKIAALQLRAKHRGMNLSTRVATFLLHRFPRGTQSLFDALARLDEASLQAERRLTIPFIKAVLQL